MNRSIRCVSSAVFLLAVFARPAVSHAQDREPLCAPVDARRLLAGPSLDAAPGDRLAAAPFATPGPAGERFVVVARDPSHTLHAGDAGSHARGVDALELAHPQRREARPSGLVVVRLGDDLAPIGPPTFVADPDRAPTAAPPSAALPVAVTLASGVLVLQRLEGGITALSIPAHGAVGTPTRVVPGAFSWLTAVARDDGAIALAGTDDGHVVALRFAPSGALQGAPRAWPVRVGGALQLLPIAHGPLAALLARPVRGSGPDGEPARVQMHVELDPGQLTPVGVPEATGLAQFPLAFATRGRTVLIFQWVAQQGLALATMTVGDRHVATRLPRLYTAQPPLEGDELGTAATEGAGHIVYDVASYGETQGEVHGHIAWVPPSGIPVVRRDVLPVRARLAAPPLVLPAADGIVVITAGTDETGAALDAWHVRCEIAR